MSSKMVAKVAIILDFTKIHISQKNAQIENIFARVIKYDIIKHFAAFGSIICFVIEKKGGKHNFKPKIA